MGNIETMEEYEARMARAKERHEARKKKTKCDQVGDSSNIIVEES